MSINTLNNLNTIGSIEVDVKDMGSIATCCVEFKICIGSTSSVIKVEQPCTYGQDGWELLDEFILNGNSTGLPEDTNSIQLQFTTKGGCLLIVCDQTTIKFKVINNRKLGFNTNINLDREIYGKQMHTAIMDIVNNEIFIRSDKYWHNIWFK